MSVIGELGIVWHGDGGIWKFHIQDLIGVNVLRLCLRKHGQALARSGYVS